MEQFPVRSDDDDDDDDEGRINFCMALSPKTTRTRNNKPDQTVSGRLFQTDAAVPGKMRSPMVERTVHGTVSYTHLTLPTNREV